MYGAEECNADSTPKLRYKLPCTALQATIAKSRQMLYAILGIAGLVNEFVCSFAWKGFPVQTEQHLVDR